MDPPWSRWEDISPCNEARNPHHDKKPKGKLKGLGHSVDKAADVTTTIGGGGGGHPLCRDQAADFSLNKTDSDQKKGRKTHFFSNSNFGLDLDYFDESNIFLKIEKVSKAANSSDQANQLWEISSKLTGLDLQ